VRSNFSYDKSNRLLKVERYNTKYFDLAGEYSYDPDGNFTSLTRSYNSDNFSYQYYSGTNRLKRVSGTTDQYTYDYNGNQTNDYFAGNTCISYDHRNLITEITRSNSTTDPPTTIKIRYKYDEAGNRTRKTIYQTQDENPSPITNDDNPTGWTITKDEYYSRDASGKEIAVYQSYTLDYWNVWGSNNEGRIKSTGMKYFYLKDHLGSIRAVINQNNVIVQAQDYDTWGHIARTWDSTSADYKFTGKERDQESSYDYFGARYYDARVGRWGSVDPLFEKHIQWTPYNYVLGNPMMLKDPDGRQVHFSSDEEVFYVTRTLDPAIGRFIEITNDLEILHNATPKRGMDESFSNLWAIETSNKPVSFKIVNDDEKFSYQNSPKKKLEPRTTSFYETKNATGRSLGGYTLPSGLCATPEEPTTFSPNNETKILINRKYGVKEGVKTMGEELMHAAKYISGEIWKHYDVETQTSHPEIDEAGDRAQEAAEKNYKKW
ncbi:MAG: RHS repeat-associated core domain-containing protein, partial [Ignavibacteriae bacterium]|nr:RHS repeat-associated core domain-containing protein [Ignavibacteriota bacterium]